MDHGMRREEKDVPQGVMTHASERGTVGPTRHEEKDDRHGTMGHDSCLREGHREAHTP